MYAQGSCDCTRTIVAVWQQLPPVQFSAGVADRLEQMCALLIRQSAPRPCRPAKDAVYTKWPFRRAYIEEGEGVPIHGGVPKGSRKGKEEGPQQLHADGLLLYGRSGCVQPHAVPIAWDTMNVSVGITGVRGWSITMTPQLTVTSGICSVICELHQTISRSESGRYVLCFCCQPVSPRMTVISRTCVRQGVAESMNRNETPRSKN